jgi:hypothetical protein
MVLLGATVGDSSKLVSESIRKFRAAGLEQPTRCNRTVNHDQGFFIRGQL